MKNTFTLRYDLFPLFKLTLPLMLDRLIQSAVWFFETLFMAHLGADQLAAGALVSWLFATCAVILYGTLSSINILVAYHYGKKDEDSIALIARDGLLLATMMGIPAFFLFWNIAPIFLLFGQSKQVVVLAESYLRPLAIGLIVDFLIMACLEVIVGVGKTQVILAFSILTVSLNIACSYILIFGKLGLPALGIAGAGWGLALSYWMTALVLVIFISVQKKYRTYFKYIFMFAKPKFLSELVQIGLPMGFMYCTEVAFFLVITLFIGLLGSQAQAANQVGIQYLSVAGAVMFAIAQAITVRMGNLLGAGRSLDIQKASNIAMSIAVIFSSIVAIGYWVFPMQLISIDFDVNNPHNAVIVHEIKNILIVAGLFQIVESMRITLFGALRGLKDTKFTLLISIITFWGIALPFGYLITIRWQLNSLGFWWGMTLGATFSIFLLEWRFQTKMRKIIKAAKLV